MKSAVKITIIYIIIASLWILLSDKLITLFSRDIYDISMFSTIKGLFYVIVTGIILYLQIKNEIDIKNKAINDLHNEVITREELIKELHHRIKNNMQVVLSLINLEMKDNEKYEKINERLNNKLISMMSVFNIVYNIHDMKNISLNNVLKEYVRICIRNIDYIETKKELTNSIEMITSIMLIIDSIMEVHYNKTIASDKVLIKITENNKIEIIFPKSIQNNVDTINQEDVDFIEILLLSINGKINYQRDSNKLEIEYNIDKDIKLN